MRLIGFSFSSDDYFEFGNGPLRRGFVELGPVSTVIGANDSGKSHLLALFHALLTGDASLNSIGEPSMMLFGACGPEEFLALTSHATSDLLPDESERQYGESDPIPGERSTWWDHIWEGAALEARDLDEGDSLSSWRSQLLNAQELDHRSEWEVILSGVTAAARRGLGDRLDQEIGLEQSILGLEPDWDEEGKRRWRIFWCLPPYGRLPSRLQEAVRTVGLSAKAGSAVWGGWASGEGGTFFGRRPESRRLREAPLVIAPVGRTDLPIGPRSLHLPIDFESVRTELESAVEDVVEKTRWTAYVLETEDVDYDNFEVDMEEAEGPWLLEEPSGAVQAHPHAVQAAKLLAGTATDLLPEFISARYRFAIKARPPHHWAEGPKTDLQLQMQGDERAPFPIGAAADGFHLWLQLALLEAGEALRGFGSVVGGAGDVLQDHHLALNEAGYHGEDVDEAERQLEDAKTRAREQLSDFAEISSLSDAWQQTTEYDLRVIPPGRVWSSVRGLVELVRGSFYVIDEPERHLHPGLQREAADWVSSKMLERSSGALLATHSVAFISTRGSKITYLWRAPGGKTHVEQVPDGILTAMDAVGLDLGLDRGELLTGFRTYLFVEGDVDQAVLETLFTRELHESGICVVPLRGSSRASGVLSANLFARYTSADLVVWLDNVSVEILRRLDQRSDSALAVKGDKNLTAEERTVADLFLEAEGRGRGIKVLPHPGEDVFDLLPDAAIKKVCFEWPGHDAARESARKARERSGVHWKRYYEDSYGLSVDVSTVAQIAQEMLRSNEFPAPLTEVIIGCRQEEEA